MFTGDLHLVGHTSYSCNMFYGHAYTHTSVFVILLSLSLSLSLDFLLFFSFFFRSFVRLFVRSCSDSLVACTYTIRIIVERTRAYMHVYAKNNGTLSVGTTTLWTYASALSVGLFFLLFSIVFLLRCPVFFSHPSK
jgi:hypothetical protein